jgi:hypothetical protein
MTDSYVENELGLHYDAVTEETWLECRTEAGERLGLMATPKEYRYVPGEGRYVYVKDVKEER